MGGAILGYFKTHQIESLLILQGQERFRGWLAFALDPGLSKPSVGFSHRPPRTPHPQFIPQTTPPLPLEAARRGGILDFVGGGVRKKQRRPLLNSKPG